MVGDLLQARAAAVDDEAAMFDRNTEFDIEYPCYLELGLDPAEK